MENKRGMVKIFGWLLFLIGAFFVVNAFFHIKDFVSTNIGAFIGLLLEVIGFSLIVVKSHANQ